MGAEKPATTGLAAGGKPPVAAHTRRRPGGYKSPRSTPQPSELSTGFAQHRHPQSRCQVAGRGENGLQVLNGFQFGTQRPEQGDGMRRAVLAAIALVASVSAAAACGAERWSVKVGTDRDAGKVATLSEATTIAELASVAAPARPGARRSSRFAPTELKTFQVTGTLTLVKKEVDEDYHIVIADPANPRITMIVEAPEPRCASGGPFLDKISIVRQTLNRKFGDIGAKLAGDGYGRCLFRYQA
jgi:hypothetical protein